MDESGCSVPDWIGFIRAARNGQEQNLEAVSDLPGGQVIISPMFLTSPLSEDSEFLYLHPVNFLLLFPFYF